MRELRHENSARETIASFRVDLYADGTLVTSVDAYAASNGSRTVSIALKGDGFHNLELRNRRVKNLQSSGYKVRFQSLSSDTLLTWIRLTTVMIASQG